MAEIGRKWQSLSLSLSLRSVAMLGFGFVLASVLASAEWSLMMPETPKNDGDDNESDFLLKVVNFLWQPKLSTYEHVWPAMKFGWKIIVGTIVGFLGAAFGSVGGVGGGGIFVPMLTLIIVFDAKSSMAISKCMIMGAAGSTVYYNLKLMHPTLDMPIIDYDLAMLFQPMLMLGISIGVAFKVIFADRMVTILLIILFLGTSTKAFLKGVETWKKETILKKEAERRSQLSGTGSKEVEYKPLPSSPSNGDQNEMKAPDQVPILQNVCWKELGLLVFVWIAFLALQISKNYTTTCSIGYWVLNLLQVLLIMKHSLNLKTLACNEDQIPIFDCCISVFPEYSFDLYQFQEKIKDSLCNLF
ncbi:Transmembrane protein TauE like [Cinnamomum micranthum f. kanehirae]|uniref:Transmembrane protein TauE like n=1 Tax=Cinnamomum micranthum f. kanehirae TaxID=337451 RepID=A0A3S3QH28_9MAGN|nr:Transmembrane protein TauE like [Cinnamomum micranthum f. kanehirae]